MSAATSYRPGTGSASNPVAIEFEYLPGPTTTKAIEWTYRPRPLGSL